MEFLTQLQKYCTKLPRSERSKLTRYWMNMPQHISTIITESSSATPTSCNNIKDYICYKCVIFLSEIKQELKERGFESLNSFISAGWAFFSLITIVILNSPTLNRADVDRMVTNIRPYLLIYIVVDHTLDNDPKALSVFKEEFSKTILSGKNSALGHLNKEVEYACSLTEEIMRLAPRSVPYIAEAARVEFSTVKLQKTQHNTLEMCYAKGSSSTLAGCAVINNGTIYPGTETIGKIGQLFDDIVDIEEDKASGIKTFALESLEKHGNIDNCVDIMGDLIAELPDSYNTVKPLFLYMLSTYFINSMFITHELRIILLDYSLLLYKGHNSNPQYFSSFKAIFNQIK